MIEFKAECGHTVRAKDEDAGKVVRCAYCGREVQVPEGEVEDDFDFFFANVVRETAEEKDREAQAKSTPRKKRRSVIGQHPRRTVDPFAVVTKMAYIAAIVIVGIFVGRKYAWPFIQDTLLAGPEAPGMEDTVANKEEPRRPFKPEAPKNKHGLIRPPLEQRGREGLFVNSVPHDVDVAVYYRKVDADDGWDDSSDAYMWIERVTAARIRPPAYTKEIRDAGVYEVVVTLPLNAPELVDRYQRFGYPKFRRKVEQNPRDRDDVATQYFLPDEAKAVTIVTTHDRINIVRRYELKIRPGEWTVLTPLFVPASCTMDEIYTTIIERDAPVRYAFDEEYIRSELQYYGVPFDDREPIINILKHTGAISYWRGYEEDAHGVAAADEGITSDKRGGEHRFHLFRISPSDGVFAFPEIVGEKRTYAKLVQYRR
jgi:hypothetical protein